MIPLRQADIDAEERAALLGLLKERFGIDPAAFARYRLVRTSKKYVSIVAVDHEMPPDVRSESVGMPFLRVNLRYPKLTTAGAQLFGKHATRNRVNLKADDASRYVRRVDLTLDALPASCSGDGYVLVFWETVPLGLGLLVDTEAPRPRMKSLYPGRWSPAGR